ncbi:hypothetical protein QBC39DRAFT_121864 [Podospora conica]|nr:hypothetical protein QBC39DRAFT_121864 [Schizothecium conicum]
MASENAAIVTPSTPSPAAVAYHATQDTRSLKRPRETTPTLSPSSAAAPDISPSKIARLAAFTRQAFSPLPLTGAAALEERRQRRAEEQRQGPPGISSNPTQQALNQLMSGGTATMSSRPQDARTAAESHADIEAAAVAAARALGVVPMPSENMSEGQEVSPHSTAGGESGVSMEDGDSQVVHSPHQMDMDGRADPRLYAQQPEAPMDDKAVAASFSYPGPPSAMTAPAPRGMSMPMPNTQNPEMVGRSPSNKRHKCDECQTEFTRHHNLKSHMLTHSQEKPYVCQDCQLRFRRLHDLKRHGKLHTGEKPHICPKCDRKFARGDALARHSKGAGGCAGRRTSMGSFPGDEDYQGQHDGDDSAMAGVLYENNADASMSEDGRGLSLPGIKAQHVPGQGGQEGFAHSNTYPPTGARPGGGLYPPSVDRGAAGPAGGPSGGPGNHAAHQIPSASMYAQSGMTESPKPLSPGGGQAGQKRSASGLSLPTHGMSPAAKRAWLSQYPPADGDEPEVNAQAGRGRGRPPGGSAQRQEGNGAVPEPQPEPVAAPAENNGTFVGHDTGIVTYFHHLDEKVKALVADAELRSKREAELVERLNAHEHTINAHEHTINTQQESIMMLSNEVTSLREQLAGAQSDGAGQEE